MEDKPVSKFNEGKPYHGSSAVEDGKLQGSTDKTDYFYFSCPTCPDRRILRLLDYDVHAAEAENPYNELLTKKSKRGFTLVFKVYCDNCKLVDFVKISNMGWQGGAFAEAMR